MVTPAATPRDVDRLRSWAPFDPAHPPDGVAASIRDVCGRWCRLRGDRRAPARRDFTPADFSGHLGNLVLIDADDAGGFRLRLVGSSITTIVGRDATGLTFEQAYRGATLHELRLIARMVRDTWAGVHVLGAVDIPGRDHIPYEAAALPLSGDGARVDMLLLRMDFGRLS